MEQMGQGLENSNETVDLESIGIIPLVPLASLINDPQILSVDGRDDRINLDGTPLAEMMRADGENIVDCSINGVVIINGEKFIVSDTPAVSVPITVHADHATNFSNIKMPMVSHTQGSFGNLYQTVTSDHAVPITVNTGHVTSSSNIKTESHTQGIGSDASVGNLLPTCDPARLTTSVDSSPNKTVLASGQKYLVSDVTADFSQGAASSQGCVSSQTAISSQHSTDSIAKKQESQDSGVEMSAGNSLTIANETVKQGPNILGGKIPIRRTNRTRSTDTGNVLNELAVPSHSQPPILASKSVALDLTGAALLNNAVLEGHDILVQVQEDTENSSMPVVTYLGTVPPEPERSLIECLWKGCGKLYDQMEDLVNHVNDQHVKVSEREVEYICKWENCPRRGKGFNARYKMLIHVRTHTKEKPHNCPLCGKSFSRLENLKIHGRSHTGEKPYRCPFEGCNKAYSNSSDRFKHVRTHQVDKPYLCKMTGCGKRYTDPSSLRKHVKIHRHFSGEDAFSEQIQDPSEEDRISTPQNFVPTTIPSTLSNLFPIQTTFQPQVTVQGNVMTFSNLSSNPLLTSTVVTNGAGPNRDDSKSDCASQFTELKDLGPETGVDMLEDEKNQETPLDLSTSPMSSMEMINTAGI